MKSHGIAEPTDFRMTEPDRTPRPLRAATGSEVEADLAHFIVNAHYAA
ncbi:MAG: hypothetical protein JWP31_2407 [Aeromicrobium sp.]|nr:hypothetical protein [Aeromicrobium sp.]